MEAASKASKQGKVKNCIHDKTFTPRAAATASMQIIDIENTDHPIDECLACCNLYLHLPSCLVLLFQLTLFVDINH